MPAPKNNSLGRGLGSLIEGIPETIGVARHPSAPLVRDTVPVSAPDPGVSLPDETSSPTQAAPESVSVTTPSRWATPRHLILMGSFLLPVLLGGVVMGVVIGRPRLAPGVATLPVVAAPRVVVVTNTVRITAPAPAIHQPGIDIGEFKALEAEGLVPSCESNTTVRLAFAEPLFSSRVVLDPEQDELLMQVGAILARHAGQWDVRVTGYADATPLKNGGPFRDNQELGLARAVEVIRYFWHQANVPMTMMHAASNGDGRLLFPGDDEATRRRNRTVTILIRTRP